MLLKHQSQVKEWLPFVNSLNNTDQALAGNGEWDEATWRANLNTRLNAVNLRHGFDDCCDREYFAVTRWGYVPGAEKLQQDLPFLFWNKDNPLA